MKFNKHKVLAIISSSLGIIKSHAKKVWTEHHCDYLSQRGRLMVRKPPLCLYCPTFPSLRNLLIYTNTNITTAIVEESIGSSSVPSVLGKLGYSITGDIDDQSEISRNGGSPRC